MSWKSSVCTAFMAITLWSCHHKRLQRNNGDQFCLAKGSDDQLHLKTSHPYYARIQDEMAIIYVEWCDFLVFSGSKSFVDRIWFDLDYWSELLLPKLQTFHVHVAQEILSERHFVECYHQWLYIDIMYSTPVNALCGSFALAWNCWRMSKIQTWRSIINAHAITCV